jgi:antitoxin ParD1/3/4
MPTRNVVLTEHHERLIGRLVKSGHYQNASEVLREGLRLVGQREAEDAARLDALRQAADTGIADIGAGRYEVVTTREDIAAYLDNIDTDDRQTSSTK